jgi:hypothetical protein
MPVSRSSPEIANIREGSLEDAQLTKEQNEDVFVRGKLTFLLVTSRTTLHNVTGHEAATTALRDHVIAGAGGSWTNAATANIRGGEISQAVITQRGASCA